MVGVEVAAAKMGAGQYAYPIERACLEFGIDLPLEKAHFLAQIAVESGNFQRLVESLNYSIEGLLKTFSRKRISADDCGRYGRTKGRAANQPMIANKVYGGPWGLENLGNLFVGDGWKFRGHGLAQTTGRYNVEQVSIGLFGDERLCDDPSPLTDPDITARAAGWYWKDHDCDRFAAKDDVIAVTKAWNGGKNGLDHRIERLAYAKKLLGVS